jgi:hypothetical protein
MKTPPSANQSPINAVAPTVATDNALSADPSVQNPTIGAARVPEMPVGVDGVAQKPKKTSKKKPAKVEDEIFDQPGLATLDAQEPLEQTSDNSESDWTKTRTVDTDAELSAKDDTLLDMRFQTLSATELPKAPDFWSQFSPAMLLAQAPGVGAVIATDAGAAAATAATASAAGATAAVAVGAASSATVLAIAGLGLVAAAASGGSNAAADEKPAVKDTDPPVITSITSTWGSSLSVTEQSAPGTLSFVTTGAENGQKITFRLNGKTYIAC